MNTQTNHLAALELTRKVDHLTDRIERLVENQRARDELFEVLTPIVAEVSAVATTRLQSMEDRGYFRFGSEAMRIIDRVVQGFSGDDLEQLGDNIVAILQTVRSLTQPDILALANGAGEALHSADRAPPVGLYGMVKASRDEDVRRGFGVALHLLRAVGRATSGTGKKADLTSRLAPRRARLQLPPPGATPPARPEVALEPPSGGDVGGTPPAVPALAGLALTKDGFLAEPQDWTEDLALVLARAAGIEQMTDEHWSLVQWARADYLEAGASPNIRRLTKGAGVGTRDVYRLFPKAPGRTIARIAGIPKPGGCL